MDLKLGFCVLSLNLLILLVAYGTEARKHFPVTAEVVEGTDAHFWIYDNQGEDNAVVHSSLNKDLEHNNNNVPSGIPQDLEHKDDIYFWIYNKQGENNHQEAKKEIAQVHSSNMDLDHKDDIYFWMYNKQGENNHQEAKKEIARVHSSNKDLGHKDDIYFWIYNKQGGNNHQEAKKENAHHRIYDKQGENSHEEAKIESSHIHSSSHNHMDHIDPSSIVFFLMDDLKLGKEITVDFPRRDLSPSPSLLPKEEADPIPFSLKELPNLLQRFSFPRNSPQGKAMEDTLRECEAPPIKGETKYCATSSEAMLDFVQKIMGEEVQFKALSTTHFTNLTSPLQKYTILDVPDEVSAPKMVACHTMPYAYAIFYCHYTISKSKVFRVSLGGENGNRVEAIAVCHLDTSQWTPNHVSFRVLGILPGTSPVCHFFPSDHLVWVPKTATSADI